MATTDFVVKNGLVVNQNANVIGNTTLGDSVADTVTINSKTTIEGLTVGTGNGSLARNTALGVTALSLVTPVFGGQDLVAVGHRALRDNTVGSSNIAVGSGALLLNTNGSDNIAIGYSTLSSNLDGNLNTAVGYTALASNTSGQNNVALGANSLGANSTSSNNVAIGYEALDLTTGGSNVALGYRAGAAITTGTNNVVIGGNTGTTIANLSNRIIISDGAGNIRISVTDTGVVSMPANVASTSTTTGTLVVTGGVGISGALNVGSNIIVASSITNQNIIRGGGAASEGGQIVIGYGNNVATAITGQANNTWNIDVAAGTANNDFRIFRQNSAGATTVAMQITEGNASISLPANVASTSTTTGTLVVTGGVGISEALNVGSNGAFAGDLTVSGGDITAGNVAATLFGGNTNTAVTIAGAQTSGAFTLGGTAQTGTITIDRSDSAHTLNIGTGANASGVTKTINFGTGGAVGSTTNVTIGSTGGGTTTVSSPEFVVSGNLTVNGTTTNINTTNLVVEDKNIVLGDVTTPTDVTADGGGITLLGATNKTLTWVDATDSWTSNQNIAAPSYTINSSTTNITFSDSGTNTRGIYGTAGGNDQWFVGGGATATDGGFLEISTGDNATEPIYVRQYTGTPIVGTVTRTATLLDGSGNTSFPGSVTGNTLASSVATGTAPLTVSSTTLVSNLNADLLDGLDQASFLRSDATDNYTSGSLTFNSGTSLIAAAGATVNFDNTTGTAPFTVASTTLVTNLNADLLDSLSSTSFLRSDTSDSFTSGTLSLSTGTSLSMTSGSILTIAAGANTLSGGPNGFVRKFSSGYSSTIVASTLYEIGRFNINGNSHNLTVIGEVRATSGSTAGISKFILNIRSQTLPTKTFTFTEEQLNFGATTSIEVWEDTLSGVVVIGYRTSTGLLNVGWDITVQERGNYNYFTQTTTLTVLDTTGLTQVTETSPNYVNNLRLSANTGSTSTTSGTLVVTGGAGISENLYVGGTLQATNLAYTGTTTSSVSTIAAAGTTQGTATQITTDLVIVSTVNVGTGVRLPASSAGKRIVIRNNGANDLRVYPSTGAQINTLGSNAPYINFSLGSTLEFIGFTSTQWYTVSATFG